jgi:hypothetical protein
MYLVASEDGREALKRNGGGAVTADSVSQMEGKVRDSSPRGWIANRTPRPCAPESTLPH